MLTLNHPTKKKLVWESLAHRQITIPQLFVIMKEKLNRLYLEYHEPAVTQRAPDSWRANAHIPVWPRRRPKVEHLVGCANGCITCDRQRERAAGEIPIPTRDGPLEVLRRGTAREGRGIEECGEIGRRHVGHEPRDRFRASEKAGQRYVHWEGRELTERRLWRRMEYGTLESRQTQGP
jgi:hypothetical protein